MGNEVFHMLMALTLLCAAGVLYAQRANPGNNRHEPHHHHYGGIRQWPAALRQGVLVRYDATTLQQVADITFGAAPTMPERPADMTDQAAMQRYRTDLQAYQTALQKRQGRRS